MRRSFAWADRAGIKGGVPFELKVALRYLAAKRKAGVSVTGVLTVAGVALGVWALTVVTSVWNGFETEFLDKLLGINAHAIVLRHHDVFRDHREIAARLEAHPEVQRAAPFVYSEVITQSPRGVQGVVLKGVDPEVSRELPLAKYIGDDHPRILEVLGARSSTSAEVGTVPGILIGTELQESLHVEVGDTISIISPYGGRSGEARTSPFQVVGTFHSGMFEFDSRMVFIALREAQRFFRLYDTVTGLEVWTEDPLRSQAILGEAVLELDPSDPFAYELRDWSRTNAGMFGAMRTQKAIISIALFFIVIVAAFNIMATLILLILEKGREIAVLKSLGASRRSVLLVFMIDGQLVGVMGCAVGIVLGLVTCSVLEHYGLRLDPRVYFLEQFPIVVKPAEVALVALGALLLSTAATLFPALRAARASPVDGLVRRTVTARKA